MGIERIDQVVRRVVTLDIRDIELNHGPKRLKFYYREILDNGQLHEHITVISKTLSDDEHAELMALFERFRTAGEWEVMDEMTLIRDPKLERCTMCCEVKGLPMNPDLQYQVHVCSACWDLIVDRYPPSADHDPMEASDETMDFKGRVDGHGD